MPRSTPFPESERAICRRLRDVRTSTRLTRVAFCAELGIDSSKYSNYEHERVLIPYAVGSNVCRRFDINQRWLATGNLPRSPYFDLAHEVEEEIDIKRPFSAVFEELLAPLIEEKFQSISRSAGRSPEKMPVENLRLFTYPRIGSWWEDGASQTIDTIVRARLLMLPAALRRDYLAHLHQASEEFIRQRASDDVARFFRGEISAEPTTPEHAKSSAMLDNEKQSDTTAGVQPNRDPLVDLINRLRVLAQQERGLQTRLARVLCVTRQAVSNWLNREDPVAPSAAATLRLLQWVEKEEEKQKRLRSVLSTAKAKAQSERKHEQPNTSDPPKR